jgi:hypothetical protein
LPWSAQARLLPHLGLVDLPAGHTLIEQDGTSPRAFFPVAGLVSLSRRYPDGSSCQVALVGREGLLGLPVFIDGGVRFTKAVVCCAGYGLALGLEPLQEEWDRGASLMQILGCYAGALKAQVLQLSARHLDYPVEQRAPEQIGQPRISASISSGLTGTPREISSQPASPTIASSSIRMPMWWNASGTPGAGRT